MNQHRSNKGPSEPHHSYFLDDTGRITRGAPYFGEPERPDSDHSEESQEESTPPLSSFHSKAAYQNKAFSPGSELNHFGKGPKGYKRSDERIYEEVCELLYRHPRIDASDMTVTVESGIVTLEGMIENRDMKRLTEDVIETCWGVVDVHNQLRVQNIVPSETKS